MSIDKIKVLDNDDVISQKEYESLQKLAKELSDFKYYCCHL